MLNDRPYLCASTDDDVQIFRKKRNGNIREVSKFVYDLVDKYIKGYGCKTIVGKNRCNGKALEYSVGCTDALKGGDICTAGMFLMVNNGKTVPRIYILYLRVILVRKEYRPLQLACGGTESASKRAAKDRTKATKAASSLPRSRKRIRS